MTFQYFWFETYPGFFCEVLPIALLVSIIFGIAKYKNDKQTSLSTKILSCAFIAYMTGLVCLVILLDVVRNCWYYVFYHMDSGIGIRFFTFDFNMIPDFWNHINAEVIGNILMFLPFGILYPFFDTKADWKKTVIVGVAVTVVIEILQPVFGRIFDINDVILNTFGVVISATVFYVISGLHKKISS